MIFVVGDNIARFTLHAGVPCAVFRGSAKTHILDRKEFRGNLHAIFQEVMGYSQAKLNSVLIPHAQGRDERLELPESALREAVVNAIAHRNYRSTANVQVYIFQDRVEVVTPGGLPAGMREEDLGSKSVPRNPLLQYALPHEAGGVDWKRHTADSRGLHGACRSGTNDPGLSRLGDGNLPWLECNVPAQELQVARRRDATHKKGDGSIPRKGKGADV